MVVKQNSQSTLAAYKVSIPESNHGDIRPTSKPPLWVMLHLAVCCGGDSTGAENLAAYSTTPGIKVSWHYNTDKDSIVQSLDERYTAWHCGSGTGNQRALAIEMAVYQRSKEEWLRRGGDYYATMQQTARITADLCKRWSIPVRLALTKDQLKSMEGGITSHLAVNRKFNPWGDSRSDHVDPDPFPWDEFLVMVKQELGQTVAPVSEPLEPEPGLAEIFLNVWPYQAVQAMYRTALKRNGSFREVMYWLNSVDAWTKPNIQKIWDGIWGSDEALKKK